MSSDKTSLALSHHQLLFQQESNSGFRTNHRVGSGHDPVGPAAGTSNNNGKATRELTGYIDHQNRYYEPERGTEFRSSVFNTGPVHWHGGNGRGSDSPSCDDGERSDGDNVEGLVNSSDNKNNDSSNTSGHSSDKDGNVKSNHLSPFG